MPEQFEVKDSGQREQYDSGMQRDLQEGKPRFSLISPADIPYEEQMITRLAVHMAKGAGKYGDRNWEKANSQKEYQRFMDSAYRHFMQWFFGERDEDHACAVFFNIIAAEFLSGRLEGKW